MPSLGLPAAFALRALAPVGGYFQDHIYNQNQNITRSITLTLGITVNSSPSSRNLVKVLGQES